MSWRSLLLMMCSVCVSAADPYDAWAQGRPNEAVAPLIATAIATDRWDAWLDAGLAAAAARRNGPALACLAAAHQRAPERSEPRDGMRALGAALPTTWCERVGPIGVPGMGWCGVTLLAVAGLLLGGAWMLQRGRGWALTIAGLLILACAPGVVAMHLDRAHHWVCTVRETQALDSSGTPQRALAEGTLLQCDTTRSFGHRTLIRLSDGSEALVATVDLDPESMNLNNSIQGSR